MMLVVFLRMGDTLVCPYCDRGVYVARWRFEHSDPPCEYALAGVRSLLLGEPFRIVHLCAPRFVPGEGICAGFYPWPSWSTCDHVCIVPACGVSPRPHWSGFTHLRARCS